MSVLFKNNLKTQLFEFNIFSKKTKLRYQCGPYEQIEHTVSFDNNLIIVVYCPCMHPKYRNNINMSRVYDSIIKWNDRIIAYCTIIGFYSMRIIKLNNILYLFAKTQYGFKIYDSKQLLFDFDSKLNIYDISYDGKQSLNYVVNTKTLYVKKLTGLDIATIFDIDISDSKITNINGCHIKWIANSSRFIQIFGLNHIHVINIQTLAENKLNGRISFYDTNNDYLIGYMDNCVILYDLKSLTPMKIIKHDLQIEEYHRTFQLFIVERQDEKYNRKFHKQQLEFYRLTPEYKFQKVTIGENYLHDCRFINNFIMDIILFEILLFDRLPSEILCIELYHQILRIF